MNVTIVGGGIIGASTAYFLSAKNVNVKVLERDPTYTEASFGRSCGGLRHQFLQTENILLGMYGSKFVRQFSSSVQFTANGYLMLFNEEQKAQQTEPGVASIGFLVKKVCRLHQVRALGVLWGSSFGHLKFLTLFLYRNLLEFIGKCHRLEPTGLCPRFKNQMSNLRAEHRFLNTPLPL